MDSLSKSENSSYIYSSVSQPEARGPQGALSKLTKRDVGWLKLI